MDLKEHMRAVARFSLDTVTEEGLEIAAREVAESINEAKAGDATHLRIDIWGTAMIFVALEKAERLDVEAAYPVLRAYIAYILSEVPTLRSDLETMFTPFPQLHAALL